MQSIKYLVLFYTLITLTLIGVLMTRRDPLARRCEDVQRQHAYAHASPTGARLGPDCCRLMRQADSRRQHAARLRADARRLAAHPIQTPEWAAELARLDEAARAGRQLVDSLLDEVQFRLQVRGRVIAQRP